MVRAKGLTERDLQTMGNEPIETPMFYFMAADTVKGGAEPCHKTRFDHTIAFFNDMANIHKQFEGTYEKWEEFWAQSLKSWPPRA